MAGESRAEEGADTAPAGATGDDNASAESTNSAQPAAPTGETAPPGPAAQKIAGQDDEGDPVIPEAVTDPSPPDTTAGTEGEAEEGDDVLRQLVDEELAKRKEALQQSLEADFEKEKQRLEQEIAKAKDDGAGSSDDPKDEK